MIYSAFRTVRLSLLAEEKNKTRDQYYYYIATDVIMRFFFCYLSSTSVDSLYDRATTINLGNNNNNNNVNLTFEFFYLGILNFMLVIDVFVLEINLPRR